MNKKKRNSFNDGVIGIYSEKDTLINTDFNAKINAKTIDDYEFIVSLCYKEQTKRNEDFLFAEAMGKNLTWKIKTPLLEAVESNHTVIYNNQTFSIINIDYDKSNNEMYFYLERGRKLA